MVKNQVLRCNVNSLQACCQGVLPESANLAEGARVTNLLTKHRKGLSSHSDSAAESHAQPLAHSVAPHRIRTEAHNAINTCSLHQAPLLA